MAEKVLTAAGLRQVPLRRPAAPRFPSAQRGTIGKEDSPVTCNAE